MNIYAFVLMSAWYTYYPVKGAVWTENIQEAALLSAAEILDLMHLHKNCAAIRVNVTSYEPENLCASEEFSSSLVAA